MPADAAEARVVDDLLGAALWPETVDVVRSSDLLEADSRRSERVESVPAGDPLQLDLATLDEHDIRGRLHEQLMDRAGDEHLTTESMAGDARRVVHRGAEEMLGFLHGVAGVDADPDPDRR